MNKKSEPVRPTLRCLEELERSIPDLGSPLSQIDHPLIKKAQRLPTEISAGNAESIRSLTDRRWFKVKVSVWRGVAGNLKGKLRGDADQDHTRWWLSAAGTRQADSSQNNFYATLSAEAHAAGPKSCSTDFLLPKTWDIRRLLAEEGVLAQKVMAELVREAARESLLNSDIRSFNIGDRNVRVRIRVHDDGQAYIAISAAGSADASFFVALLSAIPGVPYDDWLPEPDGGLGIKPEPGDIIWSALLSPESQRQLVGET